MLSVAVLKGAKGVSKMGDWISVKEAAGIVGYCARYFREAFCAEDAPLVAVRSRRLPSGRRRLLVSRESVERLVRAEMQRPQRVEG
jgi:hypothetical protein